ncbi:MAG: AAA family ATPase [Streptomycetaceae bacterium]|nr:AAA family ATPase [Streptomycetaceae bacterium]
MSPGKTGRELFGREEQITTVRAALAPAAGCRVVLLTGQAGIGKTALWEAGVAEAEDLGYAVLRTRACEAEAQLSHGGLSDLLEYVDDGVLARLAPPQYRAVRAALLRDESGPIDPRALGAGFLAVVRELAVDGLVVIAIDDDQWLDAASVSAVTYALRRLRDEPVTVLLTRRRATPGTPYGDDGITAHLATVRAEISTVDLPPLPVDAIRRLFGRPLAPRLAGRVFELSQGNPYFALEITEALRRSGGPVGPGDELPVPSSLHGLISARLAAAAVGVQRAVLVTSLMSNPRLGLVHDVLARDGTGPEDLTEDGLLVVDGDHVRLAHPLIGAVARAEAPASLRRHLHRTLAAAATDAEERVRHRALGAVPPDAEIADELARVAQAAPDRGGMRAAAALAEQAWRFTPAADPRRDERLLAAADYYLQAGLHAAGVRLLAPHLVTLPPGPLRAHARLMTIQMSGTSATAQQYDEVLAEADPRLRAETLTHRADEGVAYGIASVVQGLRWTLEAVELSRGIDDGALRVRVVSEAARMESLLGIDPADRLAAVHPTVLSDLALHDQPGRVRALRAMWRGDVAYARRILGDLRRLAEEREEELSTTIFALHLFETEMRAGDWIAAAALRDSLIEAGPHVVPEELAWRLRAAVAAGTGERSVAVEALRRLDEAVAERPFDPLFWHSVETRRTAGQAALLDGDAETAATLLAQVVEAATAGDYRDPGVFPAAPDLVEALVKAGRLDEATVALRQLADVAAEQDHPWAHAGAARARGFLLSVSAARPSSSTQDDEAEAAFGEASQRYHDLALPFDEARTITALGMLRRRQRRFREARTLLQDAADRFDTLGAAGLARTARTEATRVGGRTPESTPTTGGLTATEQQVVDLVIAGCTNRQVADRLFVSVSAVEAHLTRVYAKFGVSSRTQLVRQLSRPA